MGTQVTWEEIVRLARELNHKRGEEGSDALPLARLVLAFNDGITGAAAVHVRGSPTTEIQSMSSGAGRRGS